MANNTLPSTCDINQTQAEELCSAPDHKTVRRMDFTKKQRARKERTKLSIEAQMAKEQRRFFEKCRKKRRARDQRQAFAAAFLTPEDLAMVAREGAALKTIGLKEADFYQARSRAVVEAALLRAGIEPNPGPGHRKKGQHPGKAAQAANARTKSTVSVVVSRKELEARERQPAPAGTKAVSESDEEYDLDSAIAEVFSTTATKSPTPKEEEAVATAAPVVVTVNHVVEAPLPDPSKLKAGEVKVVNTDPTQPPPPHTRHLVTTVPLETNSIHPKRRLLDGVHPTVDGIATAFMIDGCDSATVCSCVYRAEPMDQDTRTGSVRPIKRLEQELLIADADVRVVRIDLGWSPLTAVAKKVYAVTTKVKESLGTAGLDGPLGVVVGFCSHISIGMEMAYGSTEQVTFAPHLLTEVTNEYSEKADLTVIQSSSRQKALRQTSLPISDHLSHQLMVGTDKLVPALIPGSLNAPGAVPDPNRLSPLQYVTDLNINMTRQIQQGRSMPSGTAQMRLVLKSRLARLLIWATFILLYLLTVMSVLLILGVSTMAIYRIMRLFLWIAKTPLLSAAGYASGCLGIYPRAIIFVSATFVSLSALMCVTTIAQLKSQATTSGRSVLHTLSLARQSCVSKLRDTIMVPLLGAGLHTLIRSSNWNPIQSIKMLAGSIQDTMRSKLTAVGSSLLWRRKSTKTTTS